MTYPTHPFLRIIPYPRGAADIFPVRGESAGWTAAIRDGVLRVFNAERMTHAASPWWSIADDPTAPELLRAWARLHTERGNE